MKRKSKFNIIFKTFICDLVILYLIITQKQLLNAIDFIQFVFILHRFSTMGTFFLQLIPNGIKIFVNKSNI